jgi:hypothetical protein
MPPQPTEASNEPASFPFDVASRVPKKINVVFEPGKIQETISSVKKKAKSWLEISSHPIQRFLTRGWS